MTRDEILKRMNEIAAGELTDATMTEYETLEAQLNTVTRSVEIQERNTRLNSAQRAGIQSGDGRTEEDLKDPEYRAAFNHYLRSGQQNSDLIQSRAQSVGTDSQGGFLAPDDFRMKIIERMKMFGGIANHAESVTTGDGRRLPWPVMADDTGNLGAIVAEGVGPASGQDLVFSENELNAYSYSSAGADVAAVPTPLRLSYELIQDSVFDIEGMVSRRLGERIARKQSVDLVDGTGVGEPLGISSGAGIEIAAATDIDYADLLTFVHSVDPMYRPNAKWAFNDITLKYFRGLLDANGRPLLREANDSIAGDPGGSSLLGYPVVIDQAFPNVSLASNTINWGVFGDLMEGYVIRRVKEIELLVNPYSRMNERQIEYTAWARMDATQQNQFSYIRLTGQAV